MKNEAELKLKAAKEAVRLICRANRATLTAYERQMHAQDLARYFQERMKPAAHEIIAGYAPMGEEMDVTLLLGELHKRGITCCLPVTTPGTRQLIFRKWQPNAPMKKGIFGIMEPDISCVEILPTIVLTPLLGFDTSHHRVGYGAGYYDATIEGLRAAGHQFKTIGIGFSIQQTDTIPHEEHDIALDHILTEKGEIGYDF